MSPSAPIGIFDSGVGGLSILRSIAALLPHEDLLYIADHAHVPYGDRQLPEVRGFAEGVTRFFRSRGAKLVVVACNTASAAALHPLRARFPELSFVGMEPAVKPAAEQTARGVVGVIATEATFQGELYASVVARFAAGVEVHARPCPGLVELIETGRIDGPAVEACLRPALADLSEAGIDRLALACTHYPYVRTAIERILGDGVTVIDPAEAIARQVRRVLQAEGLLAASGSAGRIRYGSTHPDPPAARTRIEALAGPLDAEAFEPLRWNDGRLEPLADGGYR
jgi:glutamate racemase